MYFSLLPDIEYDEKPISYPFSESDFVTAKNFFRRYKLNEDVFSYAVFFSRYAIEDGERPDTLAEKAYGNPFFDWVILLTNNMVNAQYDWPMTNSQIAKLLESEYENPYTDIDHYETTEIKNDVGQLILRRGAHVDEAFYNAPEFSLDPNVPTSLPYPITTRQATATLSYNDFISNINITDTGSGYESAPTVVINPSNGAVATANLSSTGKIKRINIINAGSGYEYPPIVTFTSGLASVSATATLDTNGSITAINIDGIKFDTTNSNQIYEFGNGTTIAPNGSGVGDTGGFNIGSTHLRFGDSPGVRYAVLNPVDTREINTVRVYAIRGNGTNGGETPDVNGVEDLYLQYQIKPIGQTPDNNWSDLGIIIDAVPNGTGSGVLDNYDFTLPPELKNENVYFRLYQPGNSGADYDHYGILSVNFINLDTEYVANANVIITPNPLDSNPSSISAGSATVTFGREVSSITTSSNGSNFGNIAPSITLSGGNFTRQSTASAQVDYNLTPSITDSGSGYSSATASISGGGGSNATAVVTCSNDGISSILITNKGSGYTGSPDITISAPTTQDVTVNVGDVITVGNDTWKYNGSTWLRQISKPFKYNNGNGTYVIKNGNEICRPITIAENFYRENEKKREIYLLKPSFFQSFVDDFRRKNLYKKDANFISQRLKKTG